MIVCTAHADVAMAVEAFTSGAFHFLQKPISPQAILHRIQDALALDKKRVAKATQKAAIEERLVRLTPREQEVLDLLVEGESNKCIASHLGISGRTVEKHREQIMEKMGTHSLAKLVRMILLCRQSG